VNIFKLQIKMNSELPVTRKYRKYVSLPTFLFASFRIVRFCIWTGLTVEKWSVSFALFCPLRPMGLSGLCFFTVKVVIIVSYAVLTYELTNYETSTNRMHAFLIDVLIQFSSSSCLHVLLYHIAVLVCYNFSFMFLYRYICFVCWTVANFMFFVPCILLQLITCTLYISML
jgi:hypothetical protein